MSIGSKLYYHPESESYFIERYGFVGDGLAGCVSGHLEHENAAAKAGVKVPFDCHAEGCEQPANEPRPFCWACWVRIPLNLKLDFFLDAPGEHDGDYSATLTADPRWPKFVRECVAALAMQKEGF